jgi:hypothetical protein
MARTKQTARKAQGEPADKIVRLFGALKDKPGVKNKPTIRAKPSVKEKPGLKDKPSKKRETWNSRSAGSPSPSPAQVVVPPANEIIQANWQRDNVRSRSCRW